MQADLSRRQTGKDAESRACDYLHKQGFKVLERNFTTPIGEIDIIAKKGGILHFLEVKARHGMNFGGPFEAITPLKRKRIRKTAEWYLAKHKALAMPCLFGVIGINLGKEPPEIECLTDAFE